LGVQEYSLEFDKVYKRKNFSTPKNYLDFIKNYIKFLQVRRKQKDNAVIRLEAGLGQLAAAAESTDILAKDLEIQNADIADKKTDVEAIIETVNI
jgi:dynein heavy chain